MSEPKNLRHCLSLRKYLVTLARTYWVCLAGTHTRPHPSPPVLGAVPWRVHPRTGTQRMSSMSPLAPTWSSSSRCVASVVLAAREFALKPFVHFETTLPIAVTWQKKPWLHAIFRTTLDGWKWEDGRLHNQYNHACTLQSPGNPRSGDNHPWGNRMFIILAVSLSRRVNGCWRCWSLVEPGQRFFLRLDRNLYLRAEATCEILWSQSCQEKNPALQTPKNSCATNPPRNKPTPFVFLHAWTIDARKLQVQRWCGGDEASLHHPAEVWWVWW